MEKKVTKKFYQLSALNLVTVAVLGMGNPSDTVVLMVVLGALIANHAILVKIIAELAASLAAQPGEPGGSTKKLLGLMFLKLLLLGSILVLAYFYNPILVPKVMVLMIFQLIIQVVSIKNNY